MLHRPEPDGFTYISQPAHSWVSGQLARAWGNDLFGQVTPAEEVFLAASLHDLGFLEWERNPTLDHATDRPYSFMELPTDLHLNLWSRGVLEMQAYNPYARLLVSFHYTGLAERHPVSNPPEEAQLQKKFLEEQRALQASLLQDLRRDKYYAGFCDKGTLERNRRLISIWDWMSLLIGMGTDKPVTIEQVPAANGTISLEVLPCAPSLVRLRIVPWPFRTETLLLRIPAKRLNETFTDQELMRQAFAAAPIENLSVEVVP